MLNQDFLHLDDFSQPEIVVYEIHINILFGTHDAHLKNLYVILRWPSFVLKSDCLLKPTRTNIWSK